jgi:nitrite reductase (NADH) large subunit
LIDFLAGIIPLERMFAFPKQWYEEQGIDVHLGMPVKQIFSDLKEIEIGDGRREKYDTLLLANGYNSFVPPFKGVKKEGVFTLKTLDDAQSVTDYLRSHKRAVVIGGGLLGLETARALKIREVEVEVIEFFDRLLPRQLDSQAAFLLKAQIERMGIKVHLGIATEEILGQKNVRGIKFKGGGELKADIAVIAAGIRPNIQLAKDSGLETDRGVVVNDHLQTSAPKIYAAGDVIQHQGKIYGIIPASFNQAKVAASNIIGEKKHYKGTIPSNTLKVMGIDLTSVGLVNPEEGTCEEFRIQNKEEGIYKKVAIRNGVIKGAIWMGTKKGVNEINRLISQEINVNKWKNDLLEDDFNFSIL